MNKEKSIVALNTLIETNHDRISGYEKAIEETDNGDLKILFSEFRMTSIECKNELASEVLQLGGLPAMATKTVGQLFRIWMDFKAKHPGNDRQSILNYCEYGEGLAVETYNKVLRNNLENLSAEQQSMLHLQHAYLRSERQQVKEIKHLSPMRR